MTEKELEKLFRKKFDERVVEFNPAAWEGAERLIIAGERRKRRRAIMAWSTAAVFAGFGALTFWSVTNTPLYTPNPQQMIAWPSEPDLNDVDINTIASEEPEDETVSPDEVYELNQEDLLAVESASDQYGFANSNSENASAVLSDATQSETQVVGSSAGLGRTVLSEVESIQTSSTELASRNTQVLAMSEERVEPNEANLESPVVVSAEISEPVNSIVNSGIEGEDVTNSIEEIVAVDNVSTEEIALERSSELTPASVADVVERPKHRVNEWSIGLTSGVGAAHVTEGNLGWKPSFFGGLAAEWAFAENLSLQTGVVYAQRSSTGFETSESYIDYNFGSTRVERRVTSLNTSFLEVPISIQYSLHQHEFLAGTYVGYKLMETGTTESTITENTSVQNDNYRTIIDAGSANDWDFGVQLGYAYRVDEHWRISATALMGLGDQFSAYPESMNQHVQLRLGVRYMLGL